MTFIIDIFQFHCKSKDKQVSEIKSDWTRADVTVFFPYLQSSTQFE